MKRHLAVLLIAMLTILMSGIAIYAVSGTGSDVHAPSMSVGTGDDPIPDSSSYETSKDSGGKTGKTTKKLGKGLDEEIETEDASAADKETEEAVQKGSDKIDTDSDTVIDASGGEEEGGFPWVLLIAIVLVIVALVIVIVLVRGKRKSDDRGGDPAYKSKH